MSMDRFSNPFQQAVMDRFDANTKTDAAFQLSVQRKLDDITTRLANIKAQELLIMASELDLETLVTDLNAATNTMAIKQDGEIAEIADLKKQIAAGVPVTQEQLDKVVAGLQPISDKLKAMGADATAPIPPVDPPVDPPIETTL